MRSPTALGMTLENRRRREGEREREEEEREGGRGGGEKEETSPLAPFERLSIPFDGPL
jgi:hypothetical protein